MMYYDYRIYYNDEFLGMIRAFSESDACHRAYMQTGGASAYSGRSSALYRAERIQETMSDLRIKLMERMDVIEEALGKERLLNEIIMGMSIDELKDNVEWLSNNWDIHFYGKLQEEE